ncbi:hypothetical protein HK101_010861 [Irineochytrium annulatum]|nr:hypothetical protein HK101_010861 [Irineochytrium annulatum]
MPAETVSGVSGGILPDTVRWSGGGWEGVEELPEATQDDWAADAGDSSAFAKAERVATEYAMRRAALMEKLPDGAVVIAAGFGLRYATAGIFYPFHQNTDLYYLCGLNEPDCAMVLEKRSATSHTFTLYVRPADPAKETWDGPVAGLEGAKSFFHCDKAEPIANLPNYLSQIIASPPRSLYTDLPLTSSAPDNTTPSHAASAPAIPAWTLYARPSSQKGTRKSFFSSSDPAGETTLLRCNPLGPLVANLRLIKSDAEVAVLRDAGRMTGRAMAECMRASQPGVGEAELQGVMEVGCRRRGADGLAGMLGEGEMVLMDAGAEYGGYAADCTRTWPVGGTFSREQREVYEAVLKVQRESIKKCTEKANVSLDQIQNMCFELLRVECSRLFGRKVTGAEMGRLYPHHIGHWLGLDVHDCASVSRTRKLKKGMVVTIEPGLYIPYDDAFPAKYQGIAVRIEDDIVVGETDPIVLTVEAPKEVADIEAVCNGDVRLS